MTNEKQAAILSGRALGFSDGITKEKYDLAMKMAQWKDRQFAKEKQALIEKACLWLESEATKHIGFNVITEEPSLNYDFTELFSKAMEETK